MKHARVVLKFLISGGVSTGINIAALYLLTEHFHWHYLVSAVAAFAVAFCFSFSLQKFWTFKDKGADILGRQIPAYLFVSLAALTCNTCLLFAFVHWLHLWYIAAEIIVAAIVAAGTFFAYRIFVFKNKESEALHLVPQGISFSRRLHMVLIGLCLLCTVFFATYKLSDSPALWYDEGLYSGIAAHIAMFGTQALQIAPDTFVTTENMTVGYPLLYPVALSYRLFGIGPLQGRAVLALYILLFAVVSFLLVRRLYNARIAAWSMLLLATFPMLYGNGKSVLGEVPGLFFLTAALLALSYLERSRYKSMAAYAAFGLAAGLCVATKPIYILLLGAFLITYLLRWKKIPLEWHGIAAGALAFVCCIALWVYLQFGVSASIHSVFSFYANPYGSENQLALIGKNFLRFFKESTPIYMLFLMLVWAAALWIRRKKEQISSAEISAFAFCVLVLAAYMRLPGWYRYLFPALTLSLIFFPQSALAVFAYLREKFARRVPAAVIFWIPYAAIALLAGLQLYQTTADSYVAEYYGSSLTEQITEALAPLGNSSVFLYNLPELAILLPSQEYYQYLPITDHLVLGAGNLSVLAEGSAQYAVVGTDAYAQNAPLFSRYRLYKTVDRYQILERIPNSLQK